MNLQNCPVRILIYENPQVVPLVLDLLKEIGRRYKQEFEPLVAVSITEAKERIDHAEIAFIDVQYEGREIAAKACGLEIPVIATSAVFEVNDLLSETERLKFMSKPFFKITILTKFIMDFVKIVEENRNCMAFCA